jgi:hypothetical protein
MTPTPGPTPPPAPVVSASRRQTRDRAGHPGGAQAGARDGRGSHHAITGTGPGGQITADDVRTAKVSAGLVAPTPRPMVTGDVRIPFRGVRRKIAEHMLRTQREVAQFTYMEEVDATELVELRNKAEARLASHDVKLSYLPFFIRATVDALKKQPQLNAYLDERAGEIVQRHEYHIGLAAQTPEGLMVPVIRHAERRSLLELAREVERLATSARTGHVSPSDLGGSTFTITSLGALGGLSATPIINYPEVAILAVHKIAKRPAVVDDKIVIREMMNLSLSVDHRMVDGHDAARSWPRSRPRWRRLGCSSLSRTRMADKPVSKVRSGQSQAESIEAFSDLDEARATGLRQILDENGRALAAVPALSPAELVRMYEGMLRGRLLDQHLLTMQRQGRIGLYLDARGQEAGVIAAAHALDPGRLFRSGAARSERGALPRPAAAHLPGADAGQRQRPRAWPADAGRGRVARQSPCHRVIQRGRADAARHGPGLGRAHARRADGGGRLRGRRRHQRGRLSVGAEFRGCVQGAGGVRLPEQPVGHFHAAFQPDRRAQHCHQGPGFRRAVVPGRRQRRARALRCHQRCGRPGARRQRPQLRRGRHLPHRCARSQRRSQSLPRSSRGGGVAAQGSAAAFRRVARCARRS